MNPVQIKVCGLTSVPNALACAEAGADWIGLNFHPPSPRSITLERGLEITQALQGKAVAVGLFVNRPINDLVEILRQIPGLDTVQLHGDEDLAYLLQLSRLMPGLKVIRAFRLSEQGSIARMTAYLDDSEAQGCAPYAILVDAHVDGQLGGTGQTIGFDLLKYLPDHPRMILAGGLTPENVSGRVDRVRPWMVDVASGVESSPGVKDLDRVRRFVDAVRNHFPIGA